MKMGRFPAGICVVAMALLAATVQAVDDQAGTGSSGHGGSVKEAARDVGHGVRNGARAVGHGVKTGAKAVGHGARKVTRTVGHAFRHAAHKVVGKPD